MKYVVTIQYYNFDFDKGEDAIKFTEDALNHYAGKSYDDSNEKPEISIKIIKED